VDLLARSYRYTFSALCVMDAEGAIVVGLPLARVESRLTGRRLVALPFSDVCGPVRAPAASAEADALLADALKSLRRSSGLNIELRDALPATGGHLKSSFLWHRLALESDAEVVLKRGSKSQRSSRNKAAREGVTTRVGTDRAALDAFYALHLITRRRQGVPTQPKRFIRGYERLFELGLGYVILAEYEGRPIAGAVFLAYGDTTTYKYGASDPEFLKLRPNNLVLAEAIRRACAAGHSTFDFGRSDVTNTGLAAFKRSWGAEEVELFYTYLADEAPEQGSGRLHKILAEVIQRSPVQVGQAIGTALYRHVG
jgi:CelD/BcsL family acetyltransferase involved in cellulose biosynthesis